MIDQVDGGAGEPAFIGPGQILVSGKSGKGEEQENEREDGLHRRENNLVPIIAPIPRGDGLTLVSGVRDLKVMKRRFSFFVPNIRAYVVR